MKTRFILHCAAALALCVILATSASATELKVKGNLDVYGMWSANLRDFNSDVGDPDNYVTTQRMRTYFDFVTSEDLKAVLGLEIDNIWGSGEAADWGTDGTQSIEVKHAYLDFTVPDTQIKVTAGLQYVALPSVFGHPVFDDDAAALVVSGKISDNAGIAVGYSRGVDGEDNYAPAGKYDGKDDVDMAFIAVPISVEGFSIAPYFAYAWAGANAGFDATTLELPVTDDATFLVVGANAKLTMFDPLTFAADLIYGEGETDNGDLETAGWYAALAASYKFDFATATLFTTYGTGFDDKGLDDQTVLPTLAEGWGLSPYIGGVRAFSTTHDSFATDTIAVGSDGTGLWTVGLVLDDISILDKLSHKLVLAYAEGTSDKDSAATFTEEDSGFEVYLINQYMIYENLAAINELGYFSASCEDLKDADYDLDASYFATVGFSYKF